MDEPVVDVGAAGEDDDSGFATGEKHRERFDIGVRATVIHDDFVIDVEDLPAQPETS